MAVHWATENIVADHKDIAATAMSLNAKRKCVLLAGKRVIAIIDLEKPTDIIKKLLRTQQKYDVFAAEWNPTSHMDHYFALAVGEKADLFTWNNGTIVPEKRLQAHTRTITDLNWHHTEPHMLATGAIDNFVHVWDIRDCRRPSLSLSAMAGVSQVKWNRLDSNLLASAHDCDIRVWDRRKAAQPSAYINGHLSKINCLDWAPNLSSVIATSSNDGTVKFFDVNFPKQYEVFMNTNSPVWRARYTPFGESLVTVVVPPMRRGENSLLLWSISNRSSPLHAFVGHSDVVLDFEWKNPGSSTSCEHQLVTWGRDNTLRLWKVDPEILKVCGHTLDDFSEETVTETSGNDTGEENTMNENHIKEEIEDGGVNNSKDSASAFSLNGEFSNLNSAMESCQLNSVEIITDKNKRLCQVTARHELSNAILSIVLPHSYPHTSSPNFKFCNGTNIDNPLKAELLKCLRNVASAALKRKSGCLEACIKVFISQFKSIKSCEDRNKPLVSPLSSGMIYGSQQDYNIPFPRTCGARFSGSGMLVYFTRPPSFKKVSSKAPLPRSLSALNANVNSYAPKLSSVGNGSPNYSFFYPSAKDISISMYYYRNKKYSNDNLLGKVKLAGKVLIYDVSELSAISGDISRAYTLPNPTNIEECCIKNKDAATEAGRKDISQMWSVAAYVAKLSPTEGIDNDYPWANHPFASKLISAMIDHYLDKSDVQTASMLCCTFGEKSVPIKDTAKSPMPHLLDQFWKQHGDSPYKTVHGISMDRDSYNRIRHNRSNSEGCLAETILPSSDQLNRDKASNKALLSFGQKKFHQYDEIQRCYANILYFWGHLEQRAEVTKFIQTPAEPHTGVGFETQCHRCSQTCQSAKCNYCKRFTFLCALCNLPVRGSSNFCLVCGHGGHTSHFIEWFRENDQCPSGCGCSCITEMEKSFG